MIFNWKKKIVQYFEIIEVYEILKKKVVILGKNDQKILKVF